MTSSTLKHSQTSGNGVIARSRQLDFSIIDSAVDAEEKEQIDGRTIHDSLQVKYVEEKVTEQEGKHTDRPGSAEEGICSQLGVHKHGPGKWERIILDSKNDFSSYGTDVDLKGKWVNLTTISGQKRQKTSTVTKSLINSLWETDAAESSKHAPTAACRRPADKIAGIKARTVIEKNSREGVADSKLLSTSDPDQVAGSVTLKIATDKSFPELIEVDVNLDICKNVASFKKQLWSSILSDAPPDLHAQLIGLKSRVLLTDDELLTRCIAANGVEFFLVGYDLLQFYRTLNNSYVEKLHLLAKEVSLSTIHKKNPFMLADNSSITESLCKEDTNSDLHEGEIVIN
ncbi:TELOMERIC REPEAT BINDING PROTEIN [Plasmopara halstedii]|uniref:TELOMERIC REPEAT BINDING PROTEIN n=1 Tax=Plasmopara halstedii TaxID=4781 RepID=A0A0N7L373_PLAHL|nr:TELOMERIC REPEAT BINDING PROTEIN [Plasmopara halstedii]CEG35075.1 TELOMERIC REPEAT BINDING PROTEIN [Plasmopara halstedii]|eukprot:XP_024571444.1 TELOMERIC REPEAT BINDING PROTEIN [Plasmopara halstedii]